MRVLVACEFSGVVRDAFIAQGHDAISCDLLPTESPGPHIQGDVLNVLKDTWDMLIAFPPCQHLSKAGAAFWPAKQADGRQRAAADFFMKLVNATHIPRRCVENPAGIMSSLYRKPTQYVHPWMFGDPWKKHTGLWLYGLPRLVSTNVVAPEGHWVGMNVNSVPRAELRARGVKLGTRDPKSAAKTFPGVASAMAEQWGTLGG